MKPAWLLAALTLTACTDGAARKCDQDELLEGYPDGDGDGFGAGDAELYCPGEGAGLSDSPLDCNDDDPTVFPGATERCNGIDDDCDAEIDQGFQNRIYYPDKDEDGFGAQYPAQRACEPPPVTPEVPAWVFNNEDCDDESPFVNPDAPEVCNDGIDDDCNAISDDSDPDVLESSKITFFVDNDADGYGNTAFPRQGCAPQASWVDNADDCNDNNQGVNPGATEICNEIDDDCDLLIDDDDDTIDPNSQANLFADIDGDTYGDPAVPLLACFPEPGRASPNSLDCNDADDNISPDAIDICNNGVDDDCDPTTDEDTVSGIGYYVDTDGDGFGATSTEILSCSPVGDRVTFGGDCNELATDINPGEEDICEDGTDQDCSGTDARCRDEFAVSNALIYFGGNDALRGMVLSLPAGGNDESLIDFGIRLTMLDPCTIDYYVFSRPIGNTAWTLETTSQVTHGPITQEFAFSGELNITIQAGNEYAYLAGWANCPTNLSFGAASNGSNLNGPFQLGEYVGRFADNYSGFNASLVPPPLQLNNQRIPNMAFGWSTSFND